MASVAAANKASGNGKATTSNPNPTSAQYAAQRGSIDMLMRAKDTADTKNTNGSKPPTSAATGIVRGTASATAVSAPKMSFLEAVRAQRQVRVQQLRDAPKASTQTGSVLASSAAAAAADPSNFHKGGSTGGGFSALATSSAKTKAKTKAKAAPQKQSNTAWVAALAAPQTGVSTSTPTTTTTTATTTGGASFAQVQDELEAGFQKYSRANPLGGVGTSYSGSGNGDSKDGQKQGQNKGQSQNQGQGNGQRNDVPMTATARNLKARQLMVAPQSASRREDERIAAAKKNRQYNKGGDSSSDEDVGRSALGRKKARRG